MSINQGLIKRYFRKRIRNRYNPDVVSPPGQTLLEAMEHIGMSQDVLAQRMECPQDQIKAIIEGKAAISPEIASQLEAVMGIPADFWLNRERHYQRHLAHPGELKAALWEISPH